MNQAKYSLSHRNVVDSDLHILSKFPQTKKELFDIYPAGKYPLDTGQLMQLLELRYDSTVILADNMVAGFANFYKLKRNDFCGIGNLIVNPELRGNGIGDFLLKTMVDIAIKRHNVKMIYASATSDNFPGILLYTKSGFKPHLIDTIVNNDGKIIPRINLYLEIA